MRPHHIREPFQRLHPRNPRSRLHLGGRRPYGKARSSFPGLTFTASVTLPPAGWHTHAHHQRTERHQGSVKDFWEDSSKGRVDQPLLKRLTSGENYLYTQDQPHRRAGGDTGQPGVGMRGRMRCRTTESLHPANLEGGGLGEPQGQISGHWAVGSAGSLFFLSKGRFIWRATRSIDRVWAVSEGERLQGHLNNHLRKAHCQPQDRTASF